jgi:septum formation protein
MNASMAAVSSLWLSPLPLLLASTSVTRRTMLENIGIRVDVQRPDIDERAVESAMGTHKYDAGDIARHLARAKALAVSTQQPDRLVLAGDQTLALGDRLLHKPADLAHARQQLQQLSGQTHQLHSAFALARKGQIIHEALDTAHLTMLPLSADFLERYLATAGNDICHSVGGYQLEGPGSLLFETIKGDYFTILGLPLLPLLAALRAEKVLAA